MKNIVLFLISLFTLIGCVQTSTEELDKWQILENALDISFDDLAILESISNNNDSLYILTFTYNDCYFCDIVIESEKYKQISISKEVLDVANSPTAMILSQALYVGGFPTSYLIDKELQLSSVLAGVDFRNHIDSVLNHNYSFINMSIPLVDDSAIPGMIMYSLKGLQSLKDRNIDEAKEHFLASYNVAPHFFNSYMLANIYNIEENERSTRMYKAACMRYSKHGSTPYIYKNLIDKLKKMKL